MNEPFEQDNDQLVITPELLALMQHIVDNHPNELKKLIAQALRTQPKQIADDMRRADTEHAQTSILDFLGLMELLLYETTRERDADNSLQHYLMPSINHIDTFACDTDVVQASVEHTTNKINRNPDINAQEVLYKELLKRWKPGKKIPAN